MLCVCLIDCVTIVVYISTVVRIVGTFIHNWSVSNGSWGGAQGCPRAPDRCRDTYKSTEKGTVRAGGVTSTPCVQSAGRSWNVRMVLCRHWHHRCRGCGERREEQDVQLRVVSLSVSVLRLI